MAIGHKILRTIFFMMSRDNHYEDKTVDYKELMVKRNAPRPIKLLQQYGYVTAS